MFDDRILNIDGWMSEQELEFLYSLAESMPDGAVIVEIGAWKGRSTAALYLGGGINKSVITIDTWQGQPDLRTTAHKETVTRNIFRVFIANMEALSIHPVPYTPEISGPQYLIMDSQEASYCFRDNTISMLFIDGDHNRARSDITSWLPRMKSPSIISGDDYDWVVVENAVNTILGKPDAVIGKVWIKYL